jgi:hypothetical protein
MTQEFIITVPSGDRHYFTLLDDGIRLVFEAVSKGYQEVKGNKIDDIIKNLKTILRSDRKNIEDYSFKYGVQENPETKTFFIFTEATKN